MASGSFTGGRRIAPRLTALGFLAAGVLALATAPARAADQSDLQVDQNIFISPSGEPFWAPVTDPYPIVKWFNRVDKKGNGKVDIDEFRADALYVFDALDRNHDGVLDSGEILVYEKYVVPFTAHNDVVGDDDAPQDGNKLAPNQGAAYYGLFQEPEPLTAADRNFDFRITRQEFIDQADRHFHALDKTAKGYITLDDLPKTAAEKDAHATRVAKAKPADAKPAATAPAKGD
jgi:Ca2+-binding EF-hand superfamily protein